MPSLLLCSGNPGKLVELRALLPREIDVLSLADVGLASDLPENGGTLLANALEKARFAFAHAGLPCLADDTGLEVDALSGRPGVRSARYAGEAKDPYANMELLLRELERADDRSARFRTVLALVTADGEHTFEGIVEGEIAKAPSGKGGFGYDPVFRPKGFTTTFAEMDAATKNSIGHRGRAMRSFLEFLTTN
ncbi:MAG: RdgB/HAM1 family non-canonical purine NTP pyrophosphatase [Flavobacteriales bacterium]|nr:RdgB/HAM1 family non-canonical purine NTP pyrophosphatase [Flavobacteriales bacterium]